MFFEGNHNSITFAIQMVVVAQLVRASDCGSEGRGFEPHQSPHQGKFKKPASQLAFFIVAGMIF
jgi:hypothetical protein